MGCLHLTCLPQLSVWPEVNITATDTMFNGQFSLLVLILEKNQSLFLLNIYLIMYLALKANCVRFVGIWGP